MLGRAIESVLAQTEPRLEVAVYDNASGDDTAAVVESYRRRDARVRYVGRDQNIGLTANFVDAAAHVATPYFSFLSDDDWLRPGFYAAALAALEAEPEAIFAATRVADIDERNRVLGIRGDGWAPRVYQPSEAFPRMARHGHLEWTGILFRRRALDLVNLGGGGVDIVFDVDFVLRLAALAPIVVVPVIGAVFVHRPGTGSARLSATGPAWQRIAANIESDERIPRQLREIAGVALPARVAEVTYAIGFNAARRGQREETDVAAGMLEQEYGQPGRARRLRRLCAIARLVPGGRAALESLSSWRRYRTVGWRRRPLRLADLDR